MTDLAIANSGTNLVNYLRGDRSKEGTTFRRRLSPEEVKALKFKVPGGVVTTVIGLLFAMIGVDPVRGAPRFTFGVEELYDGIGFVPVVMGLFGIAELLLAAEKRQTHMVEAELKSWMPTRQECRQSVGAIGRGTVVGFVHDWANPENTRRSWDMVARYVIPEINGYVAKLRESQKYLMDNREVFERAGKAVGII